MEPTNNGQSSGTLTVNQDDEHSVDKKIKQQVLEIRKVVNDDERNLFVEKLRSDPDYDRYDANVDWGLSVRQYLREIKRLWADQEDVAIRNIEFYWEEIPLARNQTLYPYDTNGYQFSLVRERDKFETERELRQAIGLGPYGDIPEPHDVSFKGLSSVLDRNKIEHTWVIKTHKQGPPSEHNVETVSRSVPIPKHILENAVEAADNFLQQAGVGFDITMPDYTGGDTPGV